MPGTCWCPDSVFLSPASALERLPTGSPMQLKKALQHGLIGATALVFVGSSYIPGADQPGPVLAAATELVASKGPILTHVAAKAAESTVLKNTNDALEVFRSVVHGLSHREALETAFRSYFAYKAAHPEKVKKPYLYFVDYGLPATEPRGYVFDMAALKIVEGPFTVAHGRGSGASGVPTRFSNRPGSAATSLGLYLAQETYAFHGRSGGHRYTSIGLRMAGLSGDYNDNARERGVVAHGAPYVTASRAGRSEGCPAMEQARARRLLPKLANGGMVFHFAPVEKFISNDPWVLASAE